MMTFRLSTTIIFITINFALLQQGRGEEGGAPSPHLSDCSHRKVVQGPVYKKILLLNFLRMMLKIIGGLFEKKNPNEIRTTTVLR
jgi:hypothetical protein